MQGIGPGTILSGRYTAEHRAAVYPGAEQWTARDATLDRPVLLLAVRREHPNVDAVLDAARRGAGLDNVRLSRILDVGSDGELAYIVEEALEGSQTISELLAAGPLPAPEVRRIAGETSLVLDVARHRGLHHQRLTPDLVLRTPDGDVKVRGLAIMAALAGVDDVPDQEAARTDALGVVALAYAGFTGTWPLPGASGGLPAAPRVANHVAAPSELAAGVPADLDALCRLTFANNQGPTTPGDFARQIAPWSPIPVMLQTFSPQSPRQHRSPDADVSRPADPQPADVRPTDVQPTDVRPAGPSPADPRPADPRPAAPSPAEPAPTEPSPAEPSPAEPAPAEPAPAAAPEDATRIDPAGAPRAGGHPRPARRVEERPDSQPAPPVKGPVPVAHRIPSPTGAPSGANRPRTEPPGSRPTTPGQSSGQSSAAAAAAAAAPGAGAGVAGAVPPARAASSRAPAEPTAPLGPSPVATTAARTAAALGAAGAATASAAKGLSDRFSGWSSDTKDKARQRVEGLRERRDEAAALRAAESASRAVPDGDLAERDAYAHEDDSSVLTVDETAGQATDDGRDSGLGAGRRDFDDRLEPPIPLLPPSAADPLTRDQSRLAIGIIVGFLAIALAFAVWGLSKLPSSLPGLSSSDGSTSISTPTPESESGTATSDDGDGDGSPAAAAPGQPLEFSAVVDYDPLGDGEERPEELALILDGDESTFWGSEGYRSSAFGNIKDGVGVILDLGAESTISSVELVLPSSAAGELFVTSDEAFVANRPALTDEMQPAGTFSGEGAVTSPLAADTRGRYVVVWFTEVSRQGDWYRARLAEASATS